MGGPRRLAGLRAGGGDTPATDESTGRSLVRPLADAAAEVVLAVDSSKLGHRAPERCFGLDRIRVLVTELDPRDARLDPSRDAVQLHYLSDADAWET